MVAARYVWTGVVLGIVFAATWVIFDASPTPSDQGTRIASLDGVPIVITIADSEAERIKGLSNSKKLPGSHGKLFVFSEDGFHGIWMKDMSFAIDIIWLDESLRIVDIKKDVLPNTYPTVFTPAKEARYVLEMNAQFSDSFKINIGDELKMSETILKRD